MLKNRSLLLICALALAACEGPEGDQGPMGPAGPQGIQGERGDNGLTLEVFKGTILNRNYDTANDFAAAIWIGWPNELAVLSVAVENPNGVFVERAYDAVIFGLGSSEYAVAGQSGYYVLIADNAKTLLNANYEVRVLHYTDE